MIEEILRHPSQRVALVEAETGRTLSYEELSSLVGDRGRQLTTAAAGRALVFMAMSPSIDAVVLYLACLGARLPVCLLDPHQAPVDRLTSAYGPALVLLPETIPPPAGYRGDPSFEIGGEYRLWRREEETAIELHPELSLLLTTSGSTGNPKLVRLTLDNLESNARSIAEYLGLSPDERAIQSLPLQYSYGLSVLDSHLMAGGSVVLTSHSFMRREFWAVLDEFGCGSFAGVPYMYETLERLRFDPAKHASLRTLTQAGGALRPDLIAHFHGLCASKGARMFVMYGQTEATARISYVPAERLGEKIGSIGVAIPGGELSLAPVEDDTALDEIVYQGPNVMLGYAEQPGDLGRGDVLGGVLRTGDLGAKDSDGYFSITGRLNRFAKLFGRRVSLEDVERELESCFPVRAAALDGNDRVLVLAVPERPMEAGSLASHLARHLSVPPSSVEVRIVASIPMTPAGKKDYRALRALGS